MNIFDHGRRPIKSALHKNRIEPTKGNDIKHKMTLLKEDDTMYDIPSRFDSVPMLARDRIDNKHKIHLLKEDDTMYNIPSHFTHSVPRLSRQSVTLFDVGGPNTQIPNNLEYLTPIRKNGKSYKLYGYGNNGDNQVKKDPSRVSSFKHPPMSSGNPYSKNVALSRKNSARLPDVGHPRTTVRENIDIQRYVPQSRMSVSQRKSQLYTSYADKKNSRTTNNKQSRCSVCTEFDVLKRPILHRTLSVNNVACYPEHRPSVLGDTNFKHANGDMNNFLTPSRHYFSINESHSRTPRLWSAAHSNAMTKSTIKNSSSHFEDLQMVHEQVSKYEPSVGISQKRKYKLYAINPNDNRINKLDTKISGTGTTSQQAPKLHRCDEPQLFDQGDNAEQVSYLIDNLNPIDAESAYCDDDSDEPILFRNKAVYRQEPVAPSHTSTIVKEHVNYGDPTVAESTYCDDFLDQPDTFRDRNAYKQEPVSLSHIATIVEQQANNYPDPIVADSAYCDNDLHQLRAFPDRNVFMQEPVSHSRRSAIIEHQANNYFDPIVADSAHCDMVLHQPRTVPDRNAHIIEPVSLSQRPTMVEQPSQNYMDPTVAEFIQYENVLDEPELFRDRNLYMQEPVPLSRRSTIVEPPLHNYIDPTIAESTLCENVRCERNTSVDKYVYKQEPVPLSYRSSIIDEHVDNYPRPSIAETTYGENVLDEHKTFQTRHVYRQKSIPLIRRLSSIEEHVNNFPIPMDVESTYCVDTLDQPKTVQNTNVCMQAPGFLSTTYSDVKDIHVDHETQTVLRGTLLKPILTKAKVSLFSCHPIDNGPFAYRNWERIQRPEYDDKYPETVERENHSLQEFYPSNAVTNALQHAKLESPITQVDSGSVDELPAKISLLRVPPDPTDSKFKVTQHLAGCTHSQISERHKCVTERSTQCETLKPVLSVQKVSIHNIDPSLKLMAADHRRKNACGHTYTEVVRQTSSCFLCNKPVIEDTHRHAIPRENQETSIFPNKKLNTFKPPLSAPATAQSKFASNVRRSNWEIEHPDECRVPDAKESKLFKSLLDFTNAIMSKISSMRPGNFIRKSSSFVESHASSVISDELNNLDITEKQYNPAEQPNTIPADRKKKSVYTQCGIDPPIGKHVNYHTPTIHCAGHNDDNLKLANSEKFLVLPCYQSVMADDISVPATLHKMPQQITHEREQRDTRLRSNPVLFVPKFGSNHNGYTSSIIDTTGPGCMPNDRFLGHAANMSNDRLFARNDENQHPQYNRVASSGLVVHNPTVPDIMNDELDTVRYRIPQKAISTNYRRTVSTTWQPRLYTDSIHSNMPTPAAVHLIAPTSRNFTRVNTQQIQCGDSNVTGILEKVCPTQNLKENARMPINNWYLSSDDVNRIYGRKFTEEQYPENGDNANRDWNEIYTTKSVMSAKDQPDILTKTNRIEFNNTSQILENRVKHISYNLSKHNVYSPSHSEYSVTENSYTDEEVFENNQVCSAEDCNSNTQCRSENFQLDDVSVRIDSSFKGRSLSTILQVHSITSNECGDSQANSARGVFHADRTEYTNVPLSKVERIVATGKHIFPECADSEDQWNLFWDTNDDATGYGCSSSDNETLMTSSSLNTVVSSASNTSIVTTRKSDNNVIRNFEISMSKQTIELAHRTCNIFQLENLGNFVIPETQDYPRDSEYDKSENSDCVFDNLSGVSSTDSDSLDIQTLGNLVENIGEFHGESALIFSPFPSSVNFNSDKTAPSREGSMHLPIDFHYQIYKQRYDLVIQQLKYKLDIMEEDFHDVSILISIYSEKCEMSFEEIHEYVDNTEIIPIESEDYLVENVHVDETAKESTKLRGEIDIDEIRQVCVDPLLLEQSMPATPVMKKHNDFSHRRFKFKCKELITTMRNLFRVKKKSVSDGCTHVSNDILESRAISDDDKINATLSSSNSMYNSVASTTDDSYSISNVSRTRCVETADLSSDIARRSSIDHSNVNGQYHCDSDDCTNKDCRTSEEFLGTLIRNTDIEHIQSDCESSCGPIEDENISCRSDESSNDCSLDLDEQNVNINCDHSKSNSHVTLPDFARRTKPENLGQWKAFIDDIDDIIASTAIFIQQHSLKIASVRKARQLEADALSYNNSAKVLRPLYSNLPNNLSDFLVDKLSTIRGNNPSTPYSDEETLEKEIIPANCQLPLISDSYHNKIVSCQEVDSYTYNEYDDNVVKKICLVPRNTWTFSQTAHFLKEKVKDNRRTFVEKLSSRFKRHSLRNRPKDKAITIWSDNCFPDIHVHHKDPPLPVIACTMNKRTLVSAKVRRLRAARLAMDRM